VTMERKQSCSTQRYSPIFQRIEPLEVENKELGQEISEPSRLALVLLNEFLFPCFRISGSLSQFPAHLCAV
jgi:hypothetical protein